ncbi:MAG TPA: 2-phospho-L-lactate guanylyltransferase [Candidatus Acidoferrales bacterium]|nr:2-phospho-L-lactate guanylyltransferase [Candidatus Acidoferrales bacterium]
MSADLPVAALIPVKGFARAKHRLAELLSARERALLAEAMMQDTLARALAAPSLAAAFVVTADPQVAAVAASCGARVVIEAEERGETEAVHFARARLKRAGFAAALVLPADIPLATAADIESVLAERAPAPGATLVPSHDRLGTNALLLAPPDSMTLRFGYDSFVYHLRQAAARGLALRVVENERIALDIDEPVDLKRFIERATSGETQRRLLEMGIAERLGAPRV